MADTQAYAPIKQEDIHDFRKKIDANIVLGQELSKHIGRGTGGREISLVITKLQEAKMWAGKILEAIGSELPKEYQDKAE